MVLILEGAANPVEPHILRSMFAARKQVFVDLLKWNVPVLEGRFEVDQFDDAQAVYIIVADEAGEHLGSARLLASERPHILDTLFPHLCAGPVPRSPDILEITRFCLSRHQGAEQRLRTRNQLVSALVQYAMECQVTSYTGVAELGWLQQILAFGWRCRPLGTPRPLDGKLVGALQIEIAADTPVLLARNGIYTPSTLDFAALREAA